jgi:hypothetical protein
VSRGTSDPQKTAERRWLARAQLFRGRGDGLTVRLEALAPQITVFQNGGPAFAVAGRVAAGEHPEAEMIGVYDLVEPLGPETPIYVAT